MSSLWNSSSAESGILRKNDTRDKLEDLFVFGYACKLFRDDHKALDIDQGKHLIPWMGENSLKIDRYDGRGALSDLKPYEASKEGYDATRWLGLSESERKIEQLCDEERYFALHTNEEEAELYKEEEFKRLQSNQIQYTYDEKSDVKIDKTDLVTSPLAIEEDNEPFVPAPGLDIPVNMSLPKTVKQNARIEKTASFISKQGPQMEILLKTKQSRNPQFSFLNQDDQLYRYYRHVLMAIKTGRYQIQEEQIKSEENEKQDDYLHPSLAPVNLHPIQLAPIIPQISYKPSANCSYSQLINKIKGNQSTTDQQPIQTIGDQQTQYYQMQFYQQYGYWPQVDQYFQQPSVTNPGSQNNSTQIGLTEQQYEQYMQYAASYSKDHTSVNPYAQIVSNVSKTKTEDDKEVIITPQNEISKAPVLYDQNQFYVLEKQQNHIPMSVNQPSLFSLAQYSGSESEEDDEDEETTNAQAVVIPPADIQVIIDKMASYVAKNGIDFENIVKGKGDPRFIFLEETHLYNPYYKMKLQEFQGVKISASKIPDQIPIVEEQQQKDTKPDKKNIRLKEKKIITPVSFSIKKLPNETQQVSRDKSALPVEDSTDDEEGDLTEPNQPVASNEDTSPVIQPDHLPTTTTPVQIDQTNSISVIEIDEPIMELIDLTDDLEERRDRRAEDRVKDKLALAAREKLAAKNRALQLERKKRAAAFLSQLKPQSSSKHEIDLAKLVQTETSIDAEISEAASNIPEEFSRLIYHIESDKFPPSDSNKIVEKRPRSRTNHKTNHQHHRRKSHKRSHSRKHKREKRSHERKKSKRRHHSRSRSTSKHRKVEKKDILTDIDNKKCKLEQTNNVSSSDYESDDYPSTK